MPNYTDYPRGARVRLKRMIEFPLNGNHVIPEGTTGVIRHSDIYVVEVTLDRHGSLTPRNGIHFHCLTFAMEDAQRVYQHNDPFLDIDEYIEVLEEPNIREVEDDGPQQDQNMTFIPQSASSINLVPNPFP